jgi:hypothetical protein
MMYGLILIQMTTNKNIIIIYTALIYMLFGCISEFEPPKDMKDMAGLLVVEGVILEEGTTIKLSRVVNLSEYLTPNYLFEGVNYATIRIMDEALNIVATAEQYDNLGRYIVNEKFSFVPGMKYALDIQVYWDHYRSAFVTPMKTPEIDTVSWRLNNDNSIDIMVSTHDPTNNTLYCLWDFKEDWEVRSRYGASLRYDPITRTVISQSLYGDNRYYCWASLSSSSLLLASTEKFIDAAIKDHKIHTLQPGNSRYSYLYSIQVNQYGINKEASDYFNNLQRNIDESGSLFAPQPSEITGNIQCLSDPDKPVIGYIFASKATSSRLFIPMAQLELSYFEDRGYCEERNDFTSAEEAFGSGYEILDTNVNTVSGYLYISRQCIDCMSRGLGNPQKTKPDFWPNDHR